MAARVTAFESECDMYAVFLVCLMAGAAALVILALLGAVGGHHTHGHASHAHAGRADASQGHTTHAHGHVLHVGTNSHLLAWLSSLGDLLLSVLSPINIAAGLLWFGGVGVLAQPELQGLALVPAAVAGLAGTSLARFILGAFDRAGVSPIAATADGAVGTVNATIRPDVAGEVMYTLEGLTRSLPARSVDGVAIPRGATVVITKRDRGVAWVAPLDPLDAIPAASADTRTDA